MVLNKKYVRPSALEYLRTFRTIHEDWKQKSPLAKWCYINGIGKIACSSLGLPSFQKDQKLKWYSFLGYFLCGIYIVLGVYTLIYYLLQDEFMKGLPCTCNIAGKIKADKNPN